MGYLVERPCKMCSKLYTPCLDCENDKNMFHWRTVACSKECAVRYFEQVLEARKTPTPKEVTDPTVEQNVLDESDNDVQVSEGVQGTKTNKEGPAKRSKNTVKIKSKNEQID